MSFIRIDALELNLTIFINIEIPTTNVLVIIYTSNELLLFSIIYNK